MVSQYSILLMSYVLLPGSYFLFSLYSHLKRLFKRLISDLCAQRRFRSACAFAQSDQNLHRAHFR